MRIFFAFLIGIFLIIPVFAENQVTGSGTECVYGTLNTYTGPSTIKANWDPNTINLYWYNDNQKLTVQTTSNTCDYDSGITLPASNPTKTGYTFTGWEVFGGVPAGYTMLEYIQSTGTQYINTGINSSSTIGFETEVMVTQYGSELGLFATTSSSTHYVLQAHNNALRLYFTGGTLAMTYQTDTSNYHKVSFNKNADNYIEFDGVKSLSSYSAPTINYPFYLFARDVNGALKSSSTGYFKCKYFRIYNNGNLVRNMIPAKRNNDSVVGMWDTVSETFFTNVGSGTFTAGPTIQ